MRALGEIGGKFSIAGSLFGFMWRRKLWWMLPVVFVLMVFGILIAVGSSTGVGPFIYTRSSNGLPLWRAVGGAC